MRALVVLVVVVLGLAGTAAADGPRTTAFGFDHVIHDRNLIVKGSDALPCARCHTERQGMLVGKPGHSACFGACHGPLPKAPARGAKIVTGDREKVCENCHSEAALATKYTGKLAASYPPYTIEQDFNVSFGHKQHAKVTCASCHVLDSKTKPATHARCAGCHDGAAGRGPAMSKCASCHPQAVGKPQPPELAELQNTVAATFSHSKHAGRSPTGKDCMTCHAPIRDTDDTQLPRPTVKNCALAGCHEGKGAFATTAACTRCHDRAPERFEVSRPSKRFLHSGVHDQLVKSTACGSCHSLSASGEAQVTKHASCTGTACHTDDFGAREPKICGACHNATEPWRKLAPDRGPPPQTEFGASLDHDKHKADCASCHTLRTETSELRTSRGHHACTGNGCHAVKGGVTPQLSDCNACHRLGLAIDRASTRVQASWSVRAKFQHATHAMTKNGNALACKACHSDLSGADLMTLPTPKKDACVACHDENKEAFKVTGTTCSRCHGVPK